MTRQAHSALSRCFLNAFQICGLLAVVAMLVHFASGTTLLVQRPRFRLWAVSVNGEGAAASTRSAEPGPSTGGAAHREALITAILAEDRAIQQAIDVAVRAIPNVPKSEHAIEARERLEAIRNYSAWVASQAGAASLSSGSGDPRPSISLSGLQSHLRTLRVLDDVLRLTARPTIG